MTRLLSIYLLLCLLIPATGNAQNFSGSGQYVDLSTFYMDNSYTFLSPNKQAIIQLPSAQKGESYCLTIRLDPKALPVAGQSYTLGFVDPEVLSRKPLPVPSPPLPPYQIPDKMALTALGAHTYQFTYLPRLSGKFRFMLYLQDPLTQRYYLNANTFTISALSGLPSIEPTLFFEVDGQALSDPEIQMEPGRGMTLTIVMRNTIGEVSWQVQQQSNYYRSYSIAPLPPIYDPKGIRYPFKISSPRLKPFQLGGQDLLRFHATHCGAKELPDFDAQLSIRIPTAEIRATEAFPGNRLPPARIGQNYAQEDVRFERHPAGADFSDYDRWEIVSTHPILNDGSTFAVNGTPSVRRLEGTPAVVAEDLSFRLRLSGPNNPQPIYSEEFQLGIFSESFSEVPETYDLIDLSALLPTGTIESEALAISNSGLIVGTYRQDSDTLKAVVWHQNNSGAWQFYPLEPRLPGPGKCLATIPTDINDAGRVVGRINWQAEGDTRVRFFGGQWSMSLDRGEKWEFSFNTPDSTYLNAINNRNEMVVIREVRTITGAPDNPKWIAYKDSRITTSRPDTEKEVFPRGEVKALNDLGHIAGHQGAEGLGEGAFIAIKNPWNSEELDKELLPPSLGPALFPDSRANAVNNVRRVCGDYDRKAALWEKTNEGWIKIDLHLPGFTSSAGLGINDLSQVVGNQQSGDIERAFLYDHRLRNLHQASNVAARSNWIFMLDELLEEEANWRIECAQAINNTGWVVGQARNGNSAMKKAILLKPNVSSSEFRAFDQIPLAINNRQQVILIQENTLDNTPDYCIWEAGLGSSHPQLLSDAESLRLFDLNDDLVLTGEKMILLADSTKQYESGFWAFRAEGRMETWRFQPILRGADPTFIETLGISNSNTIVGAAITLLSVIGKAWEWDGFHFDAAAPLPAVQFVDQQLGDVNNGNMALALPSWLHVGPFPSSEIASPGGVLDLNNEAFTALTTNLNLENTPQAVRGINDAGQVVGSLNYPCPDGKTNSRGFLAVPPYQQEHIRDFCDFQAFGINSQGWVAGSRDSLATLFIPDFMGSVNGQFLNLNELLPETERSIWQLAEAYAINDQSWVTGMAYRLDEDGQKYGEAKGFLLYAELPLAPAAVVPTPTIPGVEFLRGE